MKKNKIKGFTLIELVIVLAIISILSAVLIPNIIAYIRDAKIKEANKNAEVIFRATQDWLIEQEIDHIDLFPTMITGPTVAYLRNTSSTGSDGKGNLQKSAEGTVVGSEVKFDISEFIDSNISIDGSWIAVIDVENYECKYVIWKQEDPENLLTTDLTTPFNNFSEQMDYVHENGILGAYPFNDNI